MIEESRDAWQKLYAKHGMQFGGSGDLGPLDRLLKDDMLVLDAGCGEGKTTEILSRKAQVVGCDFSREGLLSLRTHRDRDLKLNLVECNLSKLPFGREKFDAVVCVHSLSHLREHGRTGAAEEIARVLRPGGFLFTEGFSRNDFRFGEGEEVEQASFVRGNGIMTHYFEKGEMPRLFHSLSLFSEAVSSRRIVYGALAGKRETVRTLLQKPV